MSKFNAVWSMLHEENLKATEGKKHRNVPYSKKKESMITHAMLNDPDYEADIVKTKEGEYTHEKINPVKTFREQFIGKVLRDNGIDKQQAADQAEKYEFSATQAQAFNDVAKESIEQFLRAGFTYKLHDKDDMSASIKMREVDERVTTSRVPNSDRTTTTKEKQHMVIVKKSGTPRWCKEKLD